MKKTTTRITTMMAIDLSNLSLENGSGGGGCSAFGICAVAGGGKICEKRKNRTTEARP